LTAPSSAPEALPFAGLGRRGASLAYELLLLVAILFIASFALLPLVTPGHAGSAQSLTVPALPQRVALGCVLFAVLAVYFVWSWSNGKRTLPMKTWRLRLVRSDGSPVPVRTALLRYLAAWIGPALALAAYAALAPAGWGAHATWLVAFNFLWAFVDRDRQFLHDRVAGTRIVMGAA
jgi:uncharacterized RDD family membrane protein YckC